MSGVETLTLAVAAFAAKEYASAITHCERALSLGLDLSAYESERGEYVPHPETSHCELVWGMSLHELGQSDVAIAHLDRAVALNQDDWRTWGNRGHVRRERGELELAVSDLSRSLERQPGYAFALFRRAQCYAALGQSANAERDLEGILLTNPFDEAPFALWQRLREQRGQPSDRSALGKPRDYFGLLQRALALSTHGELQLAIADYDAAFALSPQPIVRAYRGQTHYQLGNLELALADLEAYLAVDPSNQATLLALSDVRAKLAPQK